jgi:hypothetical protein
MWKITKEKRSGSMAQRVNYFFNRHEALVQFPVLLEEKKSDQSYE